MPLSPLAQDISGRAEAKSIPPQAALLLLVAAHRQEEQDQTTPRDTASHQPFPSALLAGGAHA